MRKATLLGLALAALALVPVANAAEFEVKMLNKGEKGAMVFEPDFIQAGVGDTIRFLPTDKGHNVEAIKGMLPEGVEVFKSKINDEYVLTIGKDGLYGVKCTPHFGMGMVALISAGTPANEDEAKGAKLAGKAKKRFEEIFAAYDASQ